MPTTLSSAISVLRGGEWLLEASDPDAVFTPERLTEEHRLIGQTTKEFVDNEVLPELDRLEQKDWALARKLVRRCGDLGLLGVDVPEVYGGVGLDKVTSMVVSEKLSHAASFGATLRRAGKPDGAPAVALRHRGTEAAAICRSCCRARSSARTASASRARDPTRSARKRAPRGSPTAASC